MYSTYLMAKTVLYRANNDDDPTGSFRNCIPKGRSPWKMLVINS